MTYIRLGYVAMSMELKNASPSRTMTFAQFQKIKDREAAIRKLERIAQTNLTNCLRLLKHNQANGIDFFRFSSRLVPLANHPELRGWDYMSSINHETELIKEYLTRYPHMRVDFHPDHFVVLNAEDKEILKTSIQTLSFHYRLLEAMGIHPAHRCVLHIGGEYNDKEKALERFIHNWGYIPRHLQEMIILENDDTVFDIKDTLYLCDKLGIPHVFDLHHHKANHSGEWEEDWQRTVQTWSDSLLPLKVHLSSPKNPQSFKAHADYVMVEELVELLQGNQGLACRIDCMLEAKQKDQAVFKMIQDLKKHPGFSNIRGANFYYEEI